MVRLRTAELGEHLFRFRGEGVLLDLDFDGGVTFSFAGLLDCRLALGRNARVLDYFLDLFLFLPLLMSWRLRLVNSKCALHLLEERRNGRLRP